jgi:hypothetical protein
MLIVMAPRIEFRLHRTRSVYSTVQNRYLEQVVIVTGNLSARPFLDSSQSEKNFYGDDSRFAIGVESATAFTRFTEQSNVC